jgi:hypothetical protein
MMHLLLDVAATPPIGEPTPPPARPDADPPQARPHEASPGEHGPHDAGPREPGPRDQGPRVVLGTLSDQRAPATPEEVRRLVEAALEDLLTDTWPRTPVAFTEWAGRVLGRPYDSGTFTLDDAYDAFEGAVHLLVPRRLGALALPADAPIRPRLEALREMEERYFRGRSSSGDVVALAQYSTPLPLAAAAAFMAGAHPDDELLEPQAGTGSLVANLVGLVRAMHVNEVDPRRRAVLEALGLSPTSEDSLRLQLDPRRYDTILTNPPFGGIGRGRYHGFGATQFAATDISQRFVAASLASLAEGGRLVAVMPEGTLGDSGIAFRTWLKSAFTPVAYIGSPEDSYRSRGVRCGTVAVVVDGRGPADSASPLIVRSPTWEEWYRAIESFAPGSEHSRRRPAPAGHRHRLAPVLDLLAAEPEPIVVPDTIPPVEIEPFETRDLPPVAWREGEAESRREEIARAGESPIFTPYRIGFRRRRSPHPRLVVETRSMAGMPAPPITATFRSPRVDAAWGRDGVLGGFSDEQADAVLRCLSAWERGHGMLISDAVGLGKAREAAALILEAIQRGRRRIVYTTKNETNVRDAIAEFRRVASGSEHGPFPAEIVCVGDYARVKKGLESLPQPDGPCLYITHAYNLAAYGAALVEVEPDCLVADEAHEFSNIGDSQRGIAWTDLHRALLQARADCVYFTATAGVTVENLAYLYGLRLWPIGGFRTWVDRKMGRASAKRAEEERAVEDVLDAERAENVAVGEAGGDPGKDADKDGWGSARNDAFFLRITPAETEQIMRELKGSGHYLARDLFRAGVEFSVDEVDLLGDGPAARAARERYDDAAELCRDVSLAIRHFARMNARDRTAGLDRSLIQSYLKQLLFELRLDTVIRLAEEGLRKGRQVVISLHNVAGDAPQEEGVSAADTVRRLNTRLEAAINRLNTRHVEKAGEGDDVEYVDLGEIPEALLAREAFLERLAALPPLQDPVRRLEDHFGPRRVAAITGRTPPKQRSALKAEFQAGLREVAIISQASKVGISLHDTNGRRRLMVIADYEWSATLFLQELGRVDRTGQLSPPEIALVASNAGGERKFSATIAARMASLGATCKGSAESTGTDALDAFEISGDIPVAAMKNTVEGLPDELRLYFTGRKFVEYMRSEDGGETLVPVRRPHDADMRVFLLELLMFPILAGHEVMCLWERERERLMTGEVAEMLAARRTGRSRGEVLRTTQLRAHPVLTLYEVLNEAGERMALVQGYVTEYMVQIQRLRGPDPRTKLPKTRRYVQFTLSDGSGMISGLELTRWEALTVRDFFGEHDSEPLTPEEVWEALRTGANVSVQGPPGTGWVLHPRRNGLIEIRGASLTKHQRALAPLGKTVGFEPTTRYLFIRPERKCVLRFLELFPPQAPVPEELVEDAA